MIAMSWWLLVVCGGPGWPDADVVADRGPHPAAVAAYVVMQRHCLKCHNARHRDARFDLLDDTGLRVDARRLVVSAAEARRRLESARIWSAIAVDREMPPYDEQPLTEAETAIIRRWLLAGAPSLAAARNHRERKQEKGARLK